MKEGGRDQKIKKVTLACKYGHDEVASLLLRIANQEGVTLGNQKEAFFLASQYLLSLFLCSK